MANYGQGMYDCIIRDQGFDESKEKKTPYLWLRFTPVKHNGTPIDDGYDREVKLYLTDATVGRVVERLRGLGWQGSSFKELEPGGEQTFNGVNVILRCLHRQQGDKVYEDWDFPAPASPQPDNKAGVAKKLDALFGKALKTTRGSAPVDVQKTTTDEDACPF